jgi:hypothetical protein
VMLRHLPLPHVRSPSSHDAYPAAAVAFGPTHPVARAAHARSLLGGQLATTSVLLALALTAALERGGEAITLASAALVVELALISGLAAARTCLHERSRDVIADGDGDIHVAEIAAERARLDSPAYRELLAGSLERALQAAEHWHDLWVSTRPPPGVRNLLGMRGAASEVAQLVRDPRTPVRAVALLDRLVCGGYAASLYAAPADTLEQELTRIRFLLAAGVPSATRSPAPSAECGAARVG